MDMEGWENGPYYADFQVDRWFFELTGLKMLGYIAAKNVVNMGRGAFFSSDVSDLPARRSAVFSSDDLIPQFGFVGDRYPSARILLVGINLGNGPSVRTANDARMMPSLKRFAESPSEPNFLAASRAYKNECQNWPVWKQHCSEILGAGKIEFDAIAYANCLPWRTGSESGFSDTVASNSVRLYLTPLIEDLKPELIIALGKKRVTPMLRMTGLSLPKVIIWNRSRALTAAVKTERAATAKSIFETVLARKGTGADPVLALQACPHTDIDLF